MRRPQNTAIETVMTTQPAQPHDPSGQYIMALVNSFPNGIGGAKDPESGRPNGVAKRVRLEPVRVGGAAKLDTRSRSIRVLTGHVR
jgi:hypothetical protein